MQIRSSILLLPTLLSVFALAACGDAALSVQQEKANTPASSSSSSTSEGRCEQWPTIADADTKATYSSHFNAGLAVIKAVDVEPVLNPKAMTTKEARIAFLSTCVAHWFSWRLDALALADERLGESIEHASTNAQRGAAMLASLEAWAKFIEAFSHTLYALEPTEVRSVAELHSAYVEGFRDAARPLIESRIDPIVTRCPSFADDVQNRACEAAGREAHALLDVAM